MRHGQLKSNAVATTRPSSLHEHSVNPSREAATPGNALTFHKETFGSLSLTLSLKGKLFNDFDFGAIAGKVAPFFRPSCSMT